VRSGHRKKVTAIAWNCTGLVLATGSADKEIIIHSHPSEKDLCSKTVPPHTRLRAHQNTVNYLAWNTTDPNMLASASEDCFIYFWDIKSPLRPTHTYKLGSKAFFLTWSSCGTKLCCLLSDDSILFLDRKTPKDTVQKNLGFRLSEVAYAANDTCLIVARNEKFEVYDVKTPKNISLLTSIYVSPGQVKTLDLDPFHSFVVTGSSDGSVNFWSTTNLTCLRSLKFNDRACSMQQVRISHSSTLIASAGDDLKIYVTGLQTDTPMAKIDHRCSNLAMAWNPKYLVLAYTARGNGTSAVCRLWQPPKRG